MTVWFSCYRCPDRHPESWRCTYIGADVPDACPVHGGTRIGSDILTPQGVSATSEGWDHPDHDPQPALLEATP
ncbi:MAG TPA: hypothetical protein PKD84_13445 [Propionicimonas sp.]|nr:hypothetical protein [Propionicimonas sp.]